VKYRKNVVKGPNVQIMWRRKFCIHKSDGDRI